MTSSDKRLLRHLVIAVLIKLVVLAVLWWLFIRDARVSVDIDDVAGKFGTSSATQTPPSQGAAK